MQLTINLLARTGLLLTIAAILAYGIAFVAPQHSYAQVETTDTSSLIEQLKARVFDLQKQLANMQQTSDADAQQSVTNDTAITDFNFVRNLSMGDRGEDVRRLQQLLNKDPDTRVALSGDGAQGRETNYFGPATASAVKRFQEKYQQEILTPVGLQSGSGFFGSGTRAKLARLFTEADDTDSLKPKEDVTDAQHCPLAMSCGPGFTAVKTGVDENQCTLWKCVSAEKTIRDIDRILITMDEVDNVTTVKIDMEENRTDSYTTNETNRDDIVEELRKKLVSQYDIVLSGFSTRSIERYLEQVIRWRNIKETKTDDDVCYSYNPKGTKTYAEGDSTQSYYTKEGRQIAIADASLVCRDGEWRTEGSLPDRDDAASFGIEDVSYVTREYVDPIQMAVDDEYTLYTIVLTNDKTYEVKINGMMRPDMRVDIFREVGYTGDVDTLMAMAKKVEVDEDAVEPLDKLEPLPNGCIDMDSARFDKLVAEGTVTKSYRDTGGEVQSIVDGSYICQGGEWEVESSDPSLSGEVRGASVSDYQALLQRLKVALQSLVIATNTQI